MRRRSAVEAEPIVGDDVGVLSVPPDRDRAGAPGGVTGIERVVGQFLQQEPSQAVGRLAGHLGQPGERGEIDGVRLVDLKNRPLWRNRRWWHAGLGRHGVRRNGMVTGVHNVFASKFGGGLHRRRDKVISAASRPSRYFRHHLDAQPRRVVDSGGGLRRSPKRGTLRNPAIDFGFEPANGRLRCRIIEGIGAGNSPAAIFRRSCWRE